VLAKAAIVGAAIHDVSALVGFCSPPVIVAVGVIAFVRAGRDASGTVQGIARHPAAAKMIFFFARQGIT
jgi:hypothetical protein